MEGLFAGIYVADNYLNVVYYYYIVEDKMYITIEGNFTYSWIIL